MPPRASLYWILGFAAVVLACPACTPDIGDSCLVHSDCSQMGDRICEPNFPGGYCTIFNCEPGTCPSEADCVAFYSAPSSSSENLACADPTERRFQRTLRRSNGEIRSGFALGDHVPLADAGTRMDPLVGGVDNLLEVGIGEDAIR